MRSSPWGTPGAWWRLARADRPIGYWLLLWPTWIGLFAAPGRFSWRNLLVFTLGVFVMRSAGCIVNDVADHRFDREVARTRTRPIAAGEIAPAAGLAGFALLALVALALLLALPARVIPWALAGGLLAVVYPLMKRVTDYPQLVLGVAFGWGGLLAWIAEGGPLAHPAPWLLLAANLAWTVAYDTAYALADRADDARIGVRSTARRFGARAIGAIAASAWAALLLWAAAWLALGAGPWAWAGWALGAALELRLLDALLAEGEEGGFRFFLRTHAVGLALALGWALEDLLGRPYSLPAF